jgi:hypothetical protein
MGHTKPNGSITDEIQSGNILASRFWITSRRFDTNRHQSGWTLGAAIPALPAEGTCSVLTSSALPQNSEHDRARTKTLGRDLNASIAHGVGTVDDRGKLCTPSSDASAVALIRAWSVDSSFVSSGHFSALTRYSAPTPHSHAQADVDDADRCQSSTEEAIASERASQPGSFRPTQAATVRDLRSLSFPALHVSIPSPLSIPATPSWSSVQGPVVETCKGKSEPVIWFVRHDP